MGRQDSRRAVVTGGASGIGAAVVAALAADGAAVAVLDLDVDRAEEVAAKHGGVAIACDVGDPGQVDAAFARVDDELGGVDVLVANAGHAPPADPDRAQQVLANIGRVAAGEPEEPLRAVTSLSPGEWDRMLRVHLTGTFLTCRQALLRMQEQRRGAIVTMASILGVAGSGSAAHYSAAKGGIIALTRSLAQDAVAAGVRVNAVAPGWIDTPMTQGSLTAETAALLRMQIPMHRFGTPEEIANVVAHLASDEASYLTGQVISPNGGLF